MTVLTSFPHPNLIKQVHPQGIVELVLNRPERKNAFVAEMYNALTHEITEADLNNQIKVVIIRGEKDFSAGNDLQDFMDHPIQYLEAPPFKLLRAAHQLSKPLLFAIKGVAVGIGATLPLHGDLVFCDSTALFKLPFLQLGLTPEGASTLLLPQRAGYLKAAELLLLGESFNAQDALDMRIINRIIEDNVYAYALQKAMQLAALPLSSLKASKALLKMHHIDTLPRIDQEGEHFIAAMQGPYVKEAIQAFKEKRQPDFRQFEQ